MEALREICQTIHEERVKTNYKHTYEDDTFKSGKEKVIMEPMSRVFVLSRHIKFCNASGDGVDQP